MTDANTILVALGDGTPDDLVELQPADFEASAISGDQHSIALIRSAERVVFHRLNFRAAISEAIRLGVPCDLWTAARAGLLELVKNLVASDPGQLDTEDQFGRTALQRAALVYGKCEPCEEVADFLIGSGARVDLCSAATLGLEDRVNDLLGAEPQQVHLKCQGSTPLNWAVRPRRNLEHSAAICRALIAAGASLDDGDEDENGMMPLHHAAEWGASGCVGLAEVLLDAGAEISAPDGRGWTALDYAKDRRREEMVEFLSSRATS